METKLIFQAVRLNNTDQYNELILLVDINILNEYNQNLLQEAIANSRTRIGFDLIERGIEVNHKDSKGQTSLHYCGAYKNWELAASILFNGGDPNIRDVYGNNAVWTSVFNARGNYELVKLMVVNSGDIVSKNTSNRSALDFARQINDQKLLDILVDNIGIYKQ